MAATANYAYGIEGMSYDDPNFNLVATAVRTVSAASPANYVLLNRRFENVGEFGYAYNPASTRRARPSISRLRQVMTGRCSISLLITRRAHAQAS